MNRKSQIIQAGWVVANPKGEFKIAARTKESVRKKLKIMLNATAIDGVPGVRPNGNYTIYPCDQDVKDCFRMENANPIPWADLEFIDGIACMRLRRNAGESNLGKTISTHPHFYYRVRNITNGKKMASFLDELIDEYMEHHPDLLLPEFISDDEEGEEPPAAAEHNTLDKLKRVGIRSKCSFEKCQIPIGSELTFTQNEEIKAVVLPNNKIEYNGKDGSMSSIAQLLLNSPHPVQGPQYWKYNGKTVLNIRSDLEKKGLYK